MPVLSLIRHAPTLWNEQGRMQGRSDVPLSDHGLTVASRWVLPDDTRQARWFSSPLRRTIQTAEVLGISPTIEDRLIEMDWGSWEGETLESLRKRLGPEMSRHESLGLDFCPPNGESPNMVMARSKPWIKKVGAMNSPVAAVTHKGVIRALTALATGWDMIGKDHHKLKPGTCRQFSVLDDGTLTLLEPDVSLTE